MSLKDFIYLDNERIRSYSAQLNGGVVEQTEKGTAHHAGGAGEAGASGLTKAFVDAKLNAEYMFEKSHTETSTLHHAAFELLVKSLEKNGLYDPQNDSYDNDKPFSEITCHLRLVDYSVLAAQLQKMGKLMPLFNKVAGKSTSQKDRESVAAMKNIAEVVDLLYGDAKILQLISTYDGRVIAQVALDEELSLPVRNLFEASSNNVLPGEWKVFCISEDEPPEIETQVAKNEISNALNQTAQVIKGLREYISTVVDAPNVIPIAIYRVLE